LESSLSFPSLYLLNPLFNRRRERGKEREERVSIKEKNGSWTFRIILMK